MSVYRSDAIADGGARIVAHARVVVVSRVIAALLTASSPLTAQSDPIANVAYPIAQRIRVQAPAVSQRALIGRVAALDSQSLAIAVTRKGTTVTVPWREIVGLGASAGIDRARGTRIGALAGLAAGAVLFADAYPEVRETDYFGIGGIVLGLVAFGLTPGIGALAGYALAPERWNPIAVPEPRGAAPVAPTVRLAVDESVRLATANEKHSGRVQSHAGDVLTLSTGDGLVTVNWRNVRSASVSGEPSRRRGMVRGVIIITAITAIGIATDPLPTAAENAGVVLGNAAFGAVIGAFFPARGRTALPVGSAGL